jgi:hypothetical protein
MLNCCLDLEEVKETGITLRDFQCLALCQGVSVDLTYCEDSATTSLDEFRKAVEEACVEAAPLSPSANGSDNPEEEKCDGEGGDDDDPLRVLVVSYNRKTLKQTGSGHFSPIAAYDKISDSVLILDTARFKYGAHWTKLPLVYEAMKPIDPDTGMPRGYALLSFVTRTGLEEDDRKSIPGGGIGAPDSPRRISVQPTSILFRSKMNQNERRRHYKDYVASLIETYPPGEDIPFEVVETYWTNEMNGHPGRVWWILEPLRASNEDERELIYQMRQLLADVKRNLNASADEGEPASKPPCCHSERDRHRHCVTADEAVLIVYLATLSEERRRQLVMNARSDASELIREELLKEAGVIASAIAVSDQLTGFEH